MTPEIGIFAKVGEFIWGLIVGLIAVVTFAFKTHSTASAAKTQGEQDHKDIEKLKEQTSDMKADIREIKTTLAHSSDSIDEIKEILKNRGSK